MASVRSLFDRAVALHCEALFHVGAARLAAAARTDERATLIELDAAQRELAARLRDLAGSVTPGWLGRDLDGLPPHPEGAAGVAHGTRRRPPAVPATADPPLGLDATVRRPLAVRLGVARLGRDTWFPVALPFLGAGNLAIDTDANDPAVAGWLRGVLLRVLAALPAGALRVLAVDAGSLGSTFAAFRPMFAGGLWRAPATDLDGFRAVLDEAEHRIRRAQVGTEPPGAAHAGTVPHGGGGAGTEPGDARTGIEPPGGADAGTESGGGGAARPGTGAVRAAQGTTRQYLLIVCATLPVGTGPAEWARLAAIAGAGTTAGVHVLLAGYPPAQPAAVTRPPRPGSTTQLVRGAGGVYWVSEPPGDASFSADRTGLAVPVVLDPGPSDDLVGAVSRRVAARGTDRAIPSFRSLLPELMWRESSATGLATTVGRDAEGPCVLRLDDATPHWLVSGRTGSGKTVFLLDALYGLASRYSPDELALYLLDFKEGVSFAEFTPSDADPSWIPHARTVGIESDREYGLAVLRALSTEMARRAVEFKRAGVTRLADLRTGRPDVAMPRLVAVIDEFHVLFAGNDRVAGLAAGLLEELARKGRSYGIHLVLASQTISGVEALFTKTESIFGQFPVRIALAGGGGILDPLNNAADALRTGTAVINSSGGVAGANRLVRFPDAEPAAVATQRHLLWAARPPGDQPPAVFAGYAEQRVVDDPTYLRLDPSTRPHEADAGWPGPPADRHDPADTRPGPPVPRQGPGAGRPGRPARPRVIVGRCVDVGLPTAAFALDGTPGRHLGVLGSSAVGADVLHAATLGLARQHDPGTATFLLCPLAAAADGAVHDLILSLRAAGHRYLTLDAVELRRQLGALAQVEAHLAAGGRREPTYLVIFGADAAGAALAVPDPQTFRNGLDDLRTVLRQGPGYGVHVLAWWRGLRRLSEDLGGSGGREDLACLVVLNVSGGDLAGFVGDYQLHWTPRANRALLIDQHEDRRVLIVPFVRPGTYERAEELP